MAIDRIIEWDDLSPKKEDILSVIENFFGGADLIEWSDESNRWIITLKGKPSLHIQECYSENTQEERWIEVFVGDDHVDVITRFQDLYTKSLADGLEKAIRNFQKYTSKMN